MNEHGPFDRIVDSSASRDKNARGILIGMGVVGIVLLVLVLPPISLLSGDEKAGTPAVAGSGQNQQQPSIGNNNPATSSQSKGSTKAPEGFEILSTIKSPAKPKGTTGPYALDISLTQPVTDGRNLGLYTTKGGKWERLGPATLINNGAAARGQVQDMPENVAVLRRLTTAVQVSGWLPTGSQPEPAAVDILTTLNPVDYRPSPDGGVIGSPSSLPSGRGNIIPTIRGADQQGIDAVNTLLASPALRDAHIAALVQIALQPGNAGIDIDYQRINPARRADFTAFISVLSDRLHQSSRSLTVTLPSPVKAGVSWDTGAYDWEELTRRADMVKLQADPDPSTYHKRVDEALGYLKGKIDMKKVSLVVGRQSYEKGSDGLRALSIRDALTLASAIEVRTTSAITPNSSVVIVGKNIFQDDGASGLRWDENAFAVSFSYPGSGGQRTVWLENALSIAFRLDLARRYGMGGIALEDASLDPQGSSVWDPIRAFAESGNIGLAQPNGVLLRPVWQIQAGSSEQGTKGNIVWKAPAQPGAYDVSLVVSDGVIRASQKLVLNVGTSGTPVAGGTPRAGSTGTPAAGAGATATRPAGTPAAGTGATATRPAGAAATPVR